MILNNLVNGEIAIIKSIDTTNAKLVKRLKSFGIFSGQQLNMQFKTAFGGPLAIKVNNSVIGIRTKDADAISLE